MKRILKNLIFIAIVIGIFTYVFGFGKFKTKEEYYTDDKCDKKVAGIIDFSISCNVIKDETDNELYKKGVLFSDKNLTFYEGETVYDIMIRLQKTKKIVVDIIYSEIFESSYVKGIFDLYEFDYGDLSGWVYHVNGVEYDKSFSSYEVKDGDVIKWLYTKNLGKDVRDE